MRKYFGKEGDTRNRIRFAWLPVYLPDTGESLWWERYVQEEVLRQVFRGLRSGLAWVAVRRRPYELRDTLRRILLHPSQR